MPLVNVTTTFNLSDYIGVDYDPRRTKVYLTTNAENNLVADKSTGELRLGGGTVAVADNGAVTATHWAPGADGNPASWQTTFHIDHEDHATRARKTVSIGPFTITTSGLLTALIQAQAVPAEYLTTVTLALDEKVAEAQGHADDAAASAALAVGLAWRGAWSAATDYAVNDAVSNAGGSYRRTVAGTTATAPSADPTNWTVLAAKGDTGATGADSTVPGPEGAPGPGSAAWTASQAVSVGTVRQAPDGSWIKSTTARTTRASFDVTEATFWGAVITTAGTIEKAAADAAYMGHVALVPPATGSPATDRANIAAAIASLPTGSVTGGTVLFGDGQWYLDGSLALLDGIRFQGAGAAATEIRLQTGASAMFAPTAPAQYAGFSDLTLSTVTGHIFDFAAGGLSQSSFERTTFVSYVAGASIIKLDASVDFLENAFRDCYFGRISTATVPAIDLKGPAGGLNANLFDRCRFDSGDGGTTPLVRIDATAASLAHDNTFRKIVVERAPAGFIEARSVNGLTLEDVQGWDVTGNYTSDFVMVGKSVTSGATSRGVRLHNVGTRYGTFAAPKGILKAASADLLDAIDFTFVTDPNGTASRGDYITAAELAASGVWTSYTPTLTGGATQAAAVMVGAYRRTGKVVDFFARATLGVGTTINGAQVSLPVAASGAYDFAALQATAIDTGTAYYTLDTYLNGAATGVDLYVSGTNGVSVLPTATVPFTWTVGDVITVHGSYRVS